jgi:hypothetical protein
VDLHAVSDGRLVVIRPIRPDDTDRLQAAHGRLSPLTRYRRFMTSKPYLSPADALYLADIDGCNHFALVATFAERDEDEDAAIIAVVRFEATMLADNVAIQRLSERCAAGPLRRVRRGNTFEVEFELPTRSADAPAIIAGCAGS